MKPLLPHEGSVGSGPCMMAGTQRREEDVGLIGNPRGNKSYSAVGKLKELRDNAARYNLDIVGVQEVRWSGKDKIKHGRWTFIYSGRDDQQHEAGVGLLLSDQASGALSSIDCINKHLMRVRFKAGGADIVSDHELVFAVILLKLSRPKAKQQSRKFAIKSLEEKETLKSYQQEVTNRLSADCASISVEVEWQNISDTILQAASTTIGRRKTTRKEWISSETEARLERRRVAKLTPLAQDAIQKNTDR
ncbi:hypothetical protein OS493_034593 [Desmophyllum pertusum]|uniref:Craniofacial development protein 2-like n=1 Tax=Desmophyllum pertusum TaxID=174260 RepID=A0A9X0D737_9CNID|nr:hypothetical protein OS493_034593 [Desmophyllum pertusum]